MLFLRKRIDAAEERISKLEQQLAWALEREANLLQRFDELKEKNEYVLAKLEQERSAAAEYRALHPADPEEALAMERMRKQFDAMMDYSGPKFDNAGGAE